MNKNQIIEDDLKLKDLKAENSIVTKRGVGYQKKKIATLHLVLNRRVIT